MNKFLVLLTVAVFSLAFYAWGGFVIPNILFRLFVGFFTMYAASHYKTRGKSLFSF